jgi:hypothetical protein
MKKKSKFKEIEDKIKEKKKIDDIIKKNSSKVLNAALIGGTYL